MKQKILILFLIILILSLVECRRIAGGNPVGPGVLTWHVKLEPSNGSFRRLCGGALIRYNWVLTAGQCLFNVRDVIVRPGVTDRLGGNEPAIFWVKNREHIIVHEDYFEDVGKMIHRHDLGLIYLEEATESLLNIIDDDDRKLITTILLPSDMNLETAGKMGIASGFGFYEDSDDAIQSMKLQMVDMMVMELDDCKQHYAPDFIGAGNLCTNTTGGRSTCLGDEGAPLVSVVDFNPTLIGIGSTALQLCTEGHPAIFTNVALYLDWILENIDDDPNGPPDSRKCNCVCNCITCPPKQSPRSETKPKVNYFWKN